MKNNHVDEQTIEASLARGYNRLQQDSDQELTLPVIPKPQCIRAGHDSLHLSGRILCEKSDVAAIASHFMTEAHRLTQQTFSLATETDQTGDIVFKLQKDLKGYRLLVSENCATLAASSTDALALGSSTLLQLLVNNPAEVPCMDLEDWPDASYRGVMLDLGRRPHTFETLRNVIRMCAFYKLNVLHLHLSDTELYAFASAHFPNLATPDATLSAAQWQELEAFSAQCGVTLLPELDLPGHAAFFLAQNPALRCDPPHANTVCLGQQHTYDFLEILLDELCQVFKRSPWFHLGADEADADGWQKCRHCQELMRQNGWTDPQELYRNFIVRANERIRAHGKRTIVWEGFGPQGQVPIPKDVIVMVFESLYHLPGDLVRAGYDIINASWQPLYLEGTQIAWPPCHIFNWNKFRWEHWWEKSAAHPNGLVIPPTPQVMGATLCSWGVSDQDEIPQIHPRLAPLAEQLWNPNSRNYRDFQQRYNTLSPAFTKTLNK